MKKANKGKVGIILALAAALSCSSAVAISELCLKEDNGVVIAAAETDIGVSARSMTADQIAAAWTSAVEESIRTGKQVTFTLEDNWTAAVSGSATSFGTGTAFINGAICVPKGADIVLDLNGHIIDRGLEGRTAVDYGYVISVAGELKISDGSATANGVITGGNNSLAGGGVYVYSDRASAIFTMTGGTISGNYGVSGGGIYVEAAECVIEGGMITDNNARCGGGIFTCYTENTPVLIKGGKINGNIADQGGGIGATDYGKFIVSGGDISYNEATTNGAGAYIDVGAFLTLTGGTVSNNSNITATNDCAAVYIGGSKFEMSGGAISDNDVKGTYGGGVLVTTSSEFVMNDGTISGNTVTRGGTQKQGGGVCVNGGTFTMNGGDITENEVIVSGPPSFGGGVSVYSGTFTMNGGIISDNVTGIGGGVSVSANGILNLNGGTITGNTADYGTYPGGIYNNGTINVSGGKVYGNVDEDGNTYNLDMPSALNITGVLPAGTYIGVKVTAAQTLTSGYASSGNKIGREASYFSSDNENFVISNNGSEVTLVAADTPVEKKKVDWSYKSYNSSSTPTEIPVEEGATYSSASYTGGAFLFNAIAQGIATATDENGRTVTNFVNVGKYYLSVKYQNAAEYEYPLNFTFEILPADFGETDVTVKADPVTYTGKELTTSVKVVLDGNLLEEGKDYTLSYKNNVNAGEGTVVIEAKGNYTGSVEQTFTIQKAKIGVRAGLTTLTFNGKGQGWEVYPEGLKGSDTVTLAVEYAPVENNVLGTYGNDLPVNVGQYAARVVLVDDNYELVMSYETYLYIVEKKVDAVWGNTEFVYTGDEHEITAYFVDVEGNEVELTVTLQEGSLTDAGKGKVITALPEGYENYTLMANTASVSFSIAKAEIEAEWPEEYSFKYNGDEKEVTVSLTGLKDEDLSGSVSYAYYDAEGNKLTSLPVEAGEYKVVISFTDDNYKLVGKTEDIFTISQASLKVTLDENLSYEYDGIGKTPLVSVKDELGNDIEYTATYASVNANGEVIGAYSTDLPVNAGRYILKLELSEGSVDQSEWISEEPFEITPQTITVDWDYGNTAAVIDDVYTYLYNGKAHQPTATAEGIALTLTGMWTNVGKGYKTVASLNDANYILDGELEVTFNIVQSKVVSVVWYEYGSDDPVGEGVTPRYEYTSVYGQDGPKLSAYGILVPADENIAWSADAETLITLNVSYDRYSSGYWTELGTYTALANLSSTDKLNNSCYMPLGINDKLNFEVTGVTHAANIADILWVVEVDGRHVVVDGNYEFIYDGEEHSPVAILIISNRYDPDYPEEGTYKVLNVGGAQTNAGTYYAYILTDDPNIEHLEVKEEDEECMFTILPENILVAWEGVNDDGEVVVTYSGKAQAPKAYVVDGNGDPVLNEKDEVIYLDVAGFTEAGTYSAVAQTDGNHKITNGVSVKFVIKQFEINPENIVWGFADGDEGNVLNDLDSTTYFIWEYDGNEHAPTATLKVTLAEGEDPVEITLTLTGSATMPGVYYSYATLDSSDPANANFVMPISRLKLKIVQDTITVIWDEDDGHTVEDGVFVYTYDGEIHVPKAYYLDRDNNRVYLNVIGNGKDTGNYLAFITDNFDISNGKTQAFRIEAKEIQADWDKTDEYDYNGYIRYPTVMFYYMVTGEGDEEVKVGVELRLGVDYTVTGFTNAGTYESEITLIGGNYKFADSSNVHEFVIAKRIVRLDWFGVDGSAEDFEWAYDGEEHAPTAVANIEGLNVIIKGAETDVGTYTAVAVLDNDNYAFAEGSDVHEFVIVGSEISIIWEGENGSAEDFEWEYDGNEHKPTAYYLDENGERVDLTVVGAGIYADDYTAYVILPSSCILADGEKNECEFKIGKRIIQGIVWKGVDGSADNFDWEYDGKYHVPTAEMARGGDLTVTGLAINKGVYTATVVLSDTANYAFDESVKEYEHEFTIHARTTDVVVEWKDENGNDTDFHWAYDGNVHCPTAWFEDVEGNLIQIPVIGGTASGGEHTATLVDIFENYDFFDGKSFCKFYIDEMEVAISWIADDGYAETDDGYTYTYVYNGKAQMPAVVADDADGNPIGLNYLIINKADGSKASAIINAGTYEVTVSPADKNYKIADGEVKSVTVIVEPKKVEAEWDETPLIYNGKNQKPKAYYIDIAGNKIELTVTVDGDSAETDITYTATAKLESDNYELNADSATTVFNIVKSTATEYKWVWDENGVGCWVEVTDGTGDNNGDGGETTEPTTPTDPVNPPEGGDNTGDGEGEGSGTTPTEPVTPGTGDGNEVDGDGNEGNIPTEPETPNPDPAEGDNPATDPNDGNKDEVEEDSEGGNGNE